MRQARSFGGPVTAAALASALFGCVETGDFGRPRQTLFTSAAETTGTVAAFVRGEPVSGFVYTDDETELRDRAWRFLMPAHERAWFGRALSELTRTRILPASLHASDRASYFRDLMDGPLRSPVSRYRRLSEDIVADAKLAAPFVRIANRVLEADRVRLKSLPFVRDLSLPLVHDAVARVGENRCLLVWVRQEAGGRAASYRYALEHLVIEAPQAEAIGAERALTALEGQLQPLFELPVVGAPGICPETDRIALDDAGLGAGTGPGEAGQPVAR